MKQDLEQLISALKKLREASKLQVDEMLMVVTIMQDISRRVSDKETIEEIANLKTKIEAIQAFY